jgi:hypothetical protein
MNLPPKYDDYETDSPQSRNKRVETYGRWRGLDKGLLFANEGVVKLHLTQF